MVTTTTQVYDYGLFVLPVVILVATAILFLVGLVLLIPNDDGKPRRSRILAVVALALGFTVVVGLLGFGTLQTYMSQNTWTFTYSVSIQGNGTSPEAVVVPIPNDEGLLAGLRLTNGMANWSLVDTPNGRGLYIVFTGSAGLRADVAIPPPPHPEPNVGPTLELPYIASEGGYAWWIYYDGQAGGEIDMTLGCYDLHAPLASGWTAAEPWCLNPRLPPLA